MWLTHDKVIKHNITTLFLKLDFKKVFDRVEHQYIFVVLERIGLKGTFLKLVRGLLLVATSKVHVNGRLMEEIDIMRGVQ